MKNLLFAVLVTATIPAHSQAVSLASLNPGYNRIDSPVVHREYLKPHHRPKGTIGTIVGVGLIGVGATLMSRPHADDLRSTGVLLYIAGVPTTIISGVILLTHLSDNRRHYSVFLSNSNVGLAYNF